MKAFAQDGLPLSGTTPLQNMERLAHETQGLQPDSTVNWQARAELRPVSGSLGPEDPVWLHLEATAAVPLTCQRCMAAVETPVEVDQWYRFVATEEIAMAEDDAAEEDLLVMAPQFDLLALLEDELLMALPLVPMHEQCPRPTVSSAAQVVVADEVPVKPNPFAVLSQLKKK